MKRQGQDRRFRAFQLRRSCGEGVSIRVSTGGCNSISKVYVHVDVHDPGSPLEILWLVVKRFSCGICTSFVDGSRVSNTAFSPQEVDRQSYILDIAEACCLVSHRVMSSSFPINDDIESEIVSRAILIVRSARSALPDGIRYAEMSSCC